MRYGWAGPTQEGVWSQKSMVGLLIWVFMKKCSYPEFYWITMWITFLVALAVLRINGYEKCFENCKVLCKCKFFKHYCYYYCSRLWLQYYRTLSLTQLKSFTNSIPQTRPQRVPKQLQIYTCWSFSVSSIKDLLCNWQINLLDSS